MAKSKYLNQKDIDQLKKALEAARFTNADFGENSEFIKERTRIYRNTWIISRLESVLTKLGELPESLPEQKLDANAQAKTMCRYEGK